MRTRKSSLRLGAMTVRHKGFSSRAFRSLAVLVALSTSLAVPNRCSAQTVNLPSDSSSGVYENGDALNLINSTIGGNVDFSANKSDVMNDGNLNNTSSVISGSTNYTQA